MIPKPLPAPSTAADSYNELRDAWTEHSRIRRARELHAPTRSEDGQTRRSPRPWPSTRSTFARMRKALKPEDARHWIHGSEKAAADPVPNLKSAKTAG